MFRRYRLLIVIYTIALVVGAREFLVARHEGPVEWLTAEWSEMTEIVETVNPDDPDTEWLRSMRSRAAGDEDDYQRRLEEALRAGAKHNELLLQEYAQLLLDRGEDWQLANLAVNRWRANHPFSARTLALRLGSGPRDEAESELLRSELARVRWIADARPEAYGQDGIERWQVHLTFRPARVVDLREAVAAATSLSLTEEQRAGFTVECRTLRACSLVPRTSR